MSRHFVSHHGDDAVHDARCARINLHMLVQFACVLRKLKETRKEDETLLDDCMIAYGSGNSDGYQHSKNNPPILHAVRGGGSLRPSRPSASLRRPRSPTFGSVCSTASAHESIVSMTAREG